MTQPPRSLDTKNRDKNSPGHVFVVDDDDEEREALCDLMRDHGYQVSEARNGREALARMRQIASPRVMLLDLLMPVMDGWDLIAAAQEQPELASFPIIVFSGKGRAPIRGAACIIEKPISPKSLLAAVREYCR